MGLEKITMPQLGESVTEGTVTGWLVSVGDKVNKYDLIAEVETDKVSADVPSSFSGIIKELVVNEGETIGVGELMCYIEVEDSGHQQSSKSIESTTQQVDELKHEDVSSKQRYSPAVLHLAQEHQIDLNTIQGTGKGGRITRKDIQNIIASKAEKQLVQHDEGIKAVDRMVPHENSVEAPKVKKEKVRNNVLDNGDIEIPVKGVRKKIAENMKKSVQTIPHGWTMTEVDVTDLVEFRNTVKDEFKKKEGVNLTFFAFFVKAVAQALKEYPMINSTWAGDKIIQKKEINISIAVAKEDALYVPVIRNADEKSVKGIAREISILANKVRQGKITADELQGGTFTVNNTGSFGSVQSMGIIYYPQAAILQVESIIKRPVVKNGGMIAIRDMVNLCMSLDHRVLDGLVCGRFLVRVKEILENISKNNTSVY